MDKASEIEKFLDDYRKIKNNIRSISESAHVFVTVKSNWNGVATEEAESMFKEIYPNPIPIIKARLEARAAKIRQQFPEVDFDA